MIFALLQSAYTRPVQAQETIWQTPVQLYETEDFVAAPFLVGDTAGRLHLLWNERQVEEDGQSSGPPAIYYMVKEGGQWSEPVDVLAQLQGGMERLDGVVDPCGYIHLVYGGTNEPFTYSRTKDTYAGSAHSWTQPAMLADHQQLGGSIALDPAGNLHVTYSATKLSIYHRVSSDWGQSWSEPRAISPPLPPEETTYALRLAADSDSNLHMTWGQVMLPVGYPPLGAFYARSTDGGQSWSESMDVAPPDHIVASILAGGDGSVHVLYIGRVGFGGRYHRWSADGGLTWSAPQPLVAPEEGSGGLSGGDLALDAEGTLHAVFSAPGGIAHSEWDGRAWSRREQINKGVPGAQEVMSIEVTQGNHLHAVWESDHHSIWYVEGRSAAPEMPTVPFLPLPTTTPEAARSTPEPVPIPTPAVVTAQADWEGTQPQPSGASGSIVLLIGALPSVLVVGGALVWQLAVKRRG